MKNVTSAKKTAYKQIAKKATTKKVTAKQAAKKVTAGKAPAKKASAKKVVAGNKAVPAKPVSKTRAGACLLYTSFTQCQEACILAIDFTGMDAALDQHDG